MAYRNARLATCSNTIYRSPISRVPSPVFVACPAFRLKALPLGNGKVGRGPSVSPPVDLLEWLTLFPANTAK